MVLSLLLSAKLLTRLLTYVHHCISLVFYFARSHTCLSITSLLLQVLQSHTLVLTSTELLVLVAYTKHLLSLSTGN